MPSLVPANAGAIGRMQRRTPPLPVHALVHIGLLCLGLCTLPQAHFVSSYACVCWHKHTLPLPMPVCAKAHSIATCAFARLYKLK